MLTGANIPYEKNEDSYDDIPHPVLCITRESSRLFFFVPKTLPWENPILLTSHS